MSKLNAISLFSNCGAGDYGFRQAGFVFHVMSDILQSRLDVCKLNHPKTETIHGDLRQTWPEVVETYKRKTKNSPLTLLAACPPCQGMSSARPKRGLTKDPHAGTKDERNLLIQVVVEVATALKPKFIVVENVPDFFLRLVWHPNFEYAVTAAQILTHQLEQDYKAFPLIADLSNFSIPQSRNRGFLILILRDSSEHDLIIKSSKIPFPKPSNVQISVGEFLKKQNLPSLDASLKLSAESHVANGMHSVPTLNEWQYKMVSSIPINSGMSAWENNLCNNCQHKNLSNNNIFCEVCNEILPKPIVKSNTDVRLIKGFKNSYKRMNPLKPSTTITTASATISSHNTIHPYENRVLSTWECALLQTFDENFDWGDSLIRFGHANIRAMIGEAVPPYFTYQIGKILYSLSKGKIINSISDTSLVEYKKAMKKLFNISKQDKMQGTMAFSPTAR